MCERFTKRARAAFEVAVEIAQDEQAHEVRPQHVFAALLRDPETLAACGVETGELRTAVKEAVCRAS